MPSRVRVAAVLAACTVAVAPVTACADPWDRPHDPPSPVGTPSAGFVPTPAPTPAATVVPRPGSWDDVHPSAGFRVVLLTAGHDGPVRALAAAVGAWADQEGADLRTVRADDDPVGGIVAAMDAGPDLVVAVGADLVDPLALVSASHLDRQFLLLGAELPEPTGNVTAVDWTGASFRGDGLRAASPFDAASFTPRRAGAAIRAGVTAVLTGMTGVVLWID